MKLRRNSINSLNSDMRSFAIMCLFLAACTSGPEPDASPPLTDRDAAVEDMNIGDWLASDETPSTRESSAVDMNAAKPSESRSSVNIWDKALHPSLHSSVYNALEILAQGDDVCLEVPADADDIPEGYENLRRGAGELWVPEGRMVCDLYPGAELCYFDTELPIYFIGSQGGKKLTAKPNASNPEIHFSDDDIVCRSTRRK